GAQLTNAAGGVETIVCAAYGGNDGLTIVFPVGPRRRGRPATSGWWTSREHDTLVVEQKLPAAHQSPIQIFKELSPLGCVHARPLLEDLVAFSARWIPAQGPQKGTINDRLRRCIFLENLRHAAFRVVQSLVDRSSIADVQHLDEA